MALCPSIVAIHNHVRNFNKHFTNCLDVYYPALLVSTGRLMSDGHADYQQGLRSFCFPVSASLLCI